MKIFRMNIRKIGSIYFLAVLIFSSSLYAQNEKDIIDEYLNILTAKNEFTGSILAAKDGKIVIANGYGLANIEHDVKNKADTKFRIGSITKQFTSMLIMMLAEENKIEFEKSISDYLPYYREDTGSKITIHHLLTHTSGIPSFTGVLGFFEMDSRDNFTPKKFILKYCSLDISGEPGTEYKYTNSGYFILGAIIEEITGKTYEENLQERIFDPLNMTNTGYDNHNRIIKNRATGYLKTHSGWENSNYLDMSTVFSAGGLYSTVEDLYKWDRALYKNEMISDDSMQKMFTPFMNNYAYGWSTAEAKEGQIYQHGGGLPGFTARIIRYVDRDAVVIVLSNTNTDGNVTTTVSSDISSIMFGDEFELPPTVDLVISEEILKRYVGKYQISESNIMTVTVESGKLMAQLKGMRKFELHAESETEFNLLVRPVKIVFDVDDSGNVNHLTIFQGNREQIAKKIQ